MTRASKRSSSTGRMVTSATGSRGRSAPRPSMNRPSPRRSSYETFLNRGGPDTNAVPVEIIRKVQGRPILAIRDPADPYRATIPPAQQQLQEANKHLDYVLLPDIRGGKMDTAAQQFRGREEEVLRITLEWLKKHKLSP